MQPTGTPDKNTQTPPSPQLSAPTPDTGGGHPLQAGEAKAGRKWKMPVIITGVVLLLAGASGGAYFGYYKNSGVIWKQALDNTAHGYDKLVSYGQEQSASAYKGIKGEGTFKFSGEGITGDGSFRGESDGVNATGSMDFGASGVRVKGEMRAVQAKNSSNPDIYLQLSGIKGLGGTFGSPAIGATLDSFDGQWVAIDHTLLDQFSAGQQSSLSKAPTAADISDAAKAIGQVNRQYLFTEDKNKAVLTDVEKVSTETKDGRETFRYKANVDKDHLKEYVIALDTALKNSKLGGWAKSNSSTFGFRELGNSITKSDKLPPIDIWVDTATRTIRTVRLHDTHNPVGSYLDLGLRYTGGDSYPFTIETYEDFKGTTRTFAATITLDTRTKVVNIEGNAEERGRTSMKGELKARLTPSDNAVKVTPPAGAKSLLELIGAFGADAAALSGPVAPSPLGTAELSPELEALIAQ